MRHLTSFHILFKQAVDRYIERPYYYILLGAVSGVVPSAIFLLGAFPAILGTRPGQLDIISSSLIQATALLLAVVLLAPIQSALAFAATNQHESKKALLKGLIHSPKWLATYVLTALALIVPTVFIAPGAILGPRLAFVLPILASENVTGFVALRRSSDIVRGRTFAILIFLLGFGIFVAMLNLPLLFFPSALTGQIFAFITNSIIVAPLFIIFLQVLFEDLIRVTKQKRPPKTGYFLHKMLVILGSIIFLLSLFKAVT